MLDSTLLKEAIADAKAVRQISLANAKVALEEAFSEKYHAMFAEKLKEDAGIGSEQPELQGDDESVSSQEIDELIKELESEVGPEGAPSAEGGADLAAASDGAPSPEVPPSPMGGEQQMVLCPVGTVATAEMPPAPVGGAPVDGAPGGFPGLPVGGGPSGVPGAPVDGAVPPTTPPITPPPSDVPPVSTDDMDEDINLDELLESLKAEIDDEKEETIDEDKKLASSGVGSSDNKKPSASAQNSSGIESGGANKTGYSSGDAKQVAKDPTDATRPNQGKNVTSTNLSTPSLGGTSGPALKAARPNCKGDFENTPKLNEDVATLQLQLNEAQDVIRYVKGQLNEVNLLNAKLLYTNKLFKEYTMNNDNKMRIVEMFDLAKNVREVKLTYANIAESLSFGGNEKKVKVSNTNASIRNITEGLASKPVASTKPSKEIISESKSSEMIAKFQKLAGIKKS